MKNDEAGTMPPYKFPEAKSVTLTELYEALGKMTEQLTNIAGSLDQLAHNSDMKRLYG